MSKRYREMRAQSSSARSDRKESKVQLRLRPAQKDALARAARLKQTTLTAFVVDHALSAAEQVLADQVHFTLSPERWEEFCRVLDAPPRDIPTLRRLLTEPSILDDSGTRASQ